MRASGLEPTVGGSKRAFPPDHLTSAGLMDVVAFGRDASSCPVLDDPRRWNRAISRGKRPARSCGKERRRRNGLHWSGRRNGQLATGRGGHHRRRRRHRG